MSGESVRDRLSTLSRGELVGLVALLVLALAAAGLWYARSLPRPVEIRAGPPRETLAPSPPPPPSPVLLVDVTGWVRRPGVYRFPEGARVIDAIEAAGGARRGAFLQALNLAAPLVDGSQVLVPREGEVPPPAAGSVGAGAGAKVNVNTAGVAELEALPGIGEVLAQRIVDHRTEHGPFTSVDRLLDVSGIGESILEQIRDLVTV